jgi:hypothetical protein
MVMQFELLFAILLSPHQLPPTGTIIMHQSKQWASWLLQRQLTIFRVRAMALECDQISENTGY